MGEIEQGYIILKADDYGDYAPANRAILDAVFLGTLNCVAVMTTFAKEEDAQQLQLAVENAPDSSICTIGLHYNQNTGKPLTKVPHLVDRNGNFRKVDPTGESWEAYAESILGYANEVEQEMEAQIRQFITLFGNTPQFIDAHNVSTSVEPMATIAIKLAQKYNIPAISLPRLYAPESEQDGVYGKQVINETLRRSYQQHGLQTAEDATLTYVNAAEDPERELLCILQHPPAGRRMEVTFHPSYPYSSNTNITTNEPAGREERRIIDATLLTLPSVIQAARVLREQGRTRGYGV